MFTLPRPQLAVYVVAALAAAWVAARYLGLPGGGPPRAASSSSRARPGRTTVRVGGAATAAVVDVSGAVRHPGVYTLPPGARVQDAVRRAGGARASADLQAVNLAAKVADGVQIVVPRRGAAAGTGAAAPGAAGAAGAGPPAGPVNLNTATEAQLDGLDGVGPATAQKILAFRQQHGGFSSVAQLDQIPGIGPKKLAALRTKVTV